MISYWYYMQTKRYHHIFDLDHCNEHIRNESSLEELVKKIAKAVKMTIVKGPIVAVGIPENPGLSALAIIDYSHISVHTFTKFDEALVDVFSCKEYDRAELERVVTEYLSTSETTIRHKEVWWGE